MLLLLPECDPDYLYQRLEAMTNIQKRTDVLAEELLSNPSSYPKLKDTLEKKQKAKEEEEKTSKLAQLMKLDISCEDFLKKFPEPEKTFADITKPVSPLYHEHAMFLLKSEFKKLQVAYIRKVLQRNNNHLWPAYKALSEFLISIPIGKSCINSTLVDIQGVFFFKSQLLSSMKSFQK